MLGGDPQKSAGTLNSERKGEGGAVRTCNPWQLVSREVQERGMGNGRPRMVVLHWGGDGGATYTQAQPFPPHHFAIGVVANHPKT